MGNSLLMGLWRLMVPVPETVWQGQVTKAAKGMVAKLAFMSEAHHRVRDFVVEEIPRAGEPLSPETIARALDLPLARVVVLLDELERNMTFLFRTNRESVPWFSWLFPNTHAVDPVRDLVLFQTWPADWTLTLLKLAGFAAISLITGLGLAARQLRRLG